MRRGRGRLKPVKHLRDVANAVREGDVEQRAEIRTGDEFEELAAAFNRMLRQLLSQQGELRSVNGELDTRLDELAQANMRLYDMNKLKSDFLATVSHELRTPLNSILGFSEVLSGIDSLDDLPALAARVPVPGGPEDELPPLDLARLVAAQQRQAAKAEPAGLVRQIVQERPSADFQQGFGRAVRQRPQPRSPPSDQANRLCDRHGGTV